MNWFLEKIKKHLLLILFLLSSLNFIKAQQLIKPMPLVKTLYRGYNNLVPLSATNCQCQIELKVINGVLIYNDGDYTLRPDKKADTVILIVHSPDNSEIFETYKLPVIEQPYYTFYWGNAVDGEKLDLDNNKLLYVLTAPNSDFKSNNQIVEIEIAVAKFPKQYKIKGGIIPENILNELRAVQSSNKKRKISVIVSVIEYQGAPLKKIGAIFIL